jgi:Asp-tRNA(Asn)/Glu-tRNA(Gln) amidotransferase A subunit family amidase
MAATVADLTIAYRVMSQPDPVDPVQRLFSPSVPPHAAAKKYIGIFREWCNEADAIVLETTRNAVDHFVKKLNYEEVEIKIPCIREGRLAHGATCLTEAADEAKTRVPASSNWLSIVNHQNRVLLSAGSHTPAVDYIKYGQIRQIIMQHLAFLFEKYPGLLVVTPTTTRAGWPIHPDDQKYGFSDANGTLKTMTYSWLANTTGCPAVTCPVGYDDPVQGEGKIPVGLMAMGEWGAEEQLLAFAKDAETYLNESYPGGRLRPKEWADVIGLAREKTKAAAKVPRE